MNLTDHLLTILIEECAETTKDACKALRFGLSDTGPSVDLTNAEMLTAECADVIAMIEALIAMGLIVKPHRNAVIRKHQRVIEFLSYSRQVGRLDCTDAQFVDLTERLIRSKPLFGSAGRA